MRSLIPGGGAETLEEERRYCSVLTPTGIVNSPKILKIMLALDFCNHLIKLYISEAIILS